MTLAALCLLAGLAYGLKGLTGFGPALLLVPAGSLLIGQPSAVAVATLLDVTSGLGLLLADPAIRAVRGGLRVGAALSVGTAGGLALLTVLPEPAAGGILAVAVLSGLVAVLFSRSRPVLTASVPISGPIAASVGLAAGVLGGITAINGPPLVLVLNRRLTPHDLRALLTQIFLVASVVRLVGVVAFGSGSLRHALTLALVCLPAQAVGLVLGTLGSRRISAAQLAVVNDCLIAVALVLAGLNLVA